MTPDDLRNEAERLERSAHVLRGWAAELQKTQALAKPKIERLVFAAKLRCMCGAGMAYDPYHEDPNLPFRGAYQWECSAILLDSAPAGSLHTPPKPFTFYDVLSEKQPSAGGESTRPV